MATKNINVLTDSNTPVVVSDSSSLQLVMGGSLKVKHDVNSVPVVTTVVNDDGTLVQVNALDVTDSGTGVVTAVTQTDGLISVTKSSLSLIGANVTVDEVLGSGDVLKLYKVYQGGTLTSGVTTGGTLVGTIDIPKDFLVKSGEVRTVTEAGKPYSGANIGDKYLDFVINTKDSGSTDQHIYIPVNDLVDVYTAALNATEVQLAIDSSNVISASIVKVDATKVELTKNDSTKVTAQAAFAAMNTSSISSMAAKDTTSADNPISVVTEVTQTDGVVTTNSARADKYGAADKALTDAKAYTNTEIQKLDVNSTAVATVSNDVVTINAVKEVDGKISVDTSDNTVALAKVAKTGAAADVSITDSGNLITATNVEGALLELAGDIAAVDYSGKADKVTGATNGNFAGLNASGNLTDSGKKATDFATAAQGTKADSALLSITAGRTGNFVDLDISEKDSNTQSISVGLTIQAVSTADVGSLQGLAEASDVKNYVSTNYKPVQSSVSDPTASGNATSFIDSITQNTNGVITATKKTIPNASTAASGLMTADQVTKLNGVATGAQVNVLEGVKFNGTDLTIDANKKVNVQAATTSQGTKADSALQSISKGTDGTYVTTTVGSKDSNNDQSVGVAVTVQSVSTADSSDTTKQGLAEASDVKDYVDGIAESAQLVIDGKADLVEDATEGAVATLDSNGNITDSGVLVGNTSIGPAGTTITGAIAALLTAVGGAIYVDANGAHIAFGSGYQLDISPTGAISVSIPDPDLTLVTYGDGSTRSFLLQGSVNHETLVNLGVINEQFN